MAFENGIARLSELIADSVTGAIVQTAATGQRIKLWIDGSISRLSFYSGAADESEPADVRVIDVPGVGTSLNLVTSIIATANQAGLALIAYRAASGAAAALRGKAVVAATGDFFSFPEGAFDGPGPRFVHRGIHYGWVDVTVPAGATNASVNIPHRFTTAAPAVAVVACGSATTAYCASVGSLSASPTEFAARVFHRAGTAAASATVIRLYWVAALGQAT